MGETRGRWGGVALIGLLLSSLAVGPIFGQDAPEEGTPAEAEDAGPRLEWGIEAKANFRDSDLNRFPVHFPSTPQQLPPGPTRGFEETVNAGSHFEVSNVALLLEAGWGAGLNAHVKIDFIGLYDRNPTSGDKKVDVDEAWVRFGRETDPAFLPEREGFGGLSLKIGKLPKFERQDDRHLESYGLVAENDEMPTTLRWRM